MNTDHLPERWSYKGKMKTSTQLMSFRLPTFLTAQIDALAMIFPQRNRTEIVTDLLMVALEDLMLNLPKEPIPSTATETGFEDGIYSKFRHYSNELYKMREKGWTEPIFNTSADN